MLDMIARLPSGQDMLIVLLKLMWCIYRGRYTKIMTLFFKLIIITCITERGEAGAHFTVNNYLIKISVSHSEMKKCRVQTDMMRLDPEKHLTSGVWRVGGVFVLCCAMKRMREFVSGEPRTPTLDLRLAFICARRDLSRAGGRRTPLQENSIGAIFGKYKLPPWCLMSLILCNSGAEECICYRLWSHLWM